MNSMNSLTITRRTKLSAFRTLWMILCTCASIFTLIHSNNGAHTRKCGGRSLLSFVDGDNPGYDKVKDQVKILLDKYPGRLFDQLHMSFKTVWTKFPEYQIKFEGMKHDNPKGYKIKTESQTTTAASDLKVWKRAAMDKFKSYNADRRNMANSCTNISRITKFILQDFCGITTHAVKYTKHPVTSGGYHCFNVIVTEDGKPMLIDIQGAINIETCDYFEETAVQEWNSMWAAYCPNMEETWFHSIDRKMFDSKAGKSPDEFGTDYEEVMPLTVLRQVFTGDNWNKLCSGESIQYGSGKSGGEFQIIEDSEFDMEDFKEEFFARINTFARFVMKEFERLTDLSPHKFLEEKEGTKAIDKANRRVVQEYDDLRAAVSRGKSDGGATLEKYDDDFSLTEDLQFATQQKYEYEEIDFDF